MIQDNEKNVQFYISRMIPTIVTMVSLCFGLSAIRMAIAENFEIAIRYIVIAGMLDVLDGKLARVMKSETIFGAEMDSLCDFANFGIVPAFVSYIWIFQDVKIFGWGVSMFFVVCMAARLARFNAMEFQAKVSKKNQEKTKERPYFFIGTPAPAGATMILFPLILDNEFGIGKFANLNLIYQFAVALMLVSNIPTFSFKYMKVKKEFKNLVIILFAIFSISLVIEFSKTVCFMVVLYIVTIPYFYFKYRKYIKD